MIYLPLVLERPVSLPIPVGTFECPHVQVWTDGGQRSIAAALIRDYSEIGSVLSHLVDPAVRPEEQLRELRRREKEERRRGGARTSFAHHRLIAVRQRLARRCGDADERYRGTRVLVRDTADRQICSGRCWP